MTADRAFIEYGGRIVAVAGRTRCYFAVDDLDAATLMIGPHNFADPRTTDEHLADRLVVPVEQVAVARREFEHRP